jgi:hypothetical protein
LGQLGKTHACAQRHIAHEYLDHGVFHKNTYSTVSLYVVKSAAKRRSMDGAAALSFK